MDFLTLDTVVWACVFGTLLSLGTGVVRAGVEAWKPHWKQPLPTVGVPHVLTRSQTWWNGVVLLALPMALGALFAWLFKGYPFPKGYDAGASRIGAGILVGGFSGQLYSLAKKLLSLRINTLMGGTPDTDGVLSKKVPKAETEELSNDDSEDDDDAEDSRTGK